MKKLWDVDDTTVVTVKMGGFGRNSLTVYGVRVPAKLSLRKKSNTSFILKDGRRATLTIRPQFATAPAVELRVDGRLLVETDSKPLQCAACQTAVKPNDQFCENCGHAMPSGEDHAHQKNVKQAARTMGAPRPDRRSKLFHSRRQWSRTGKPRSSTRNGGTSSRSDGCSRCCSAAH